MHRRTAEKERERAMDKRETTRLFRLLQQLYPNCSKFQEETSMLAWQLVLEPFEYDAIKANAINFARETRYPPDPADLCKGLLKRGTAAIKAKHCGEIWQDAINAGCCRDAADEFGTVSRRARERGISWRSAKMEVSA